MQCRSNVFEHGTYSASIRRLKFEGLKCSSKVRKTARIKNRYNQVQHLSKDIKLESKKITNKSQEVSPFPSGDHKAAMNRRESMTNTRYKWHKWATKGVLPWNGQRALKEESKVANRDWVDHQARSLLQYINVIANLFIMGNYFHKLRWKNMRANNLLQFIQ